MKFKQPFSKILVELRTQKHLSIKELSNKSGVSERHIIYLEQGVHEPSLEIIFKLIEALGSDPIEIIQRVTKNGASDEPMS
ncbi:MAG: helix-turn-helix transcriptional regulator [Bacteroidetes bacterium]|nr:helix-turn-helix transcriptional regulator [Bacteroidota bacterium]